MQEFPVKDLPSELFFRQSAPKPDCLSILSA